MKKWFYLFIIPIFIVGCSESGDPGPLRHTAIIYMVAQNSLSDYTGYDIEEIKLSQKDIPADCRVAVYVDDYNREPNGGLPYIRLFSNNNEQIYRYTNEIASTDSAAMVEVLERIMRMAPAQNYSLTLWSHGSGWVPSRRNTPNKAFGQDRGKWMEIPTLRGVLERLPHLRFVFFDACFMQCIEVAYEFRHVTDWMIGSPAEIPGNGAPYHLILKDLCEMNIEGILQNYHDGYQDPYGAPMSAIRTEQLDSLAQATAHSLAPLFAERQCPDFKDIQQYKGRLGSTEAYDIQSAVYHLADSATYVQWNSVLNEVVPLRQPVSAWTTEQTPYKAYLTDPQHFGGVSIHLPSDTYDTNGYNAFFHRYEWYKAAGWDATGW